MGIPFCFIRSSSVSKLLVCRSVAFTSLISEERVWEGLFEHNTVAEGNRGRPRTQFTVWAGTTIILPSSPLVHDLDQPSLVIHSSTLPVGRRWQWIWSHHKAQYSDHSTQAGAQLLSQFWRLIFTNYLSLLSKSKLRCRDDSRTPSLVQVTKLLAGAGSGTTGAHNRSSQRPYPKENNLFSLSLITWTPTLNYLYDWVLEQSARVKKLFGGICCENQIQMHVIIAAFIHPIPMATTYGWIYTPIVGIIHTDSGPRLLNYSTCSSSLKHAIWKHLKDNAITFQNWAWKA